MTKPRNLFTQDTEQQDTEHFDRLLQGGGVRLERILSTGQVTPSGRWYDQDTDEWVALLQGEAELAFSDGPSVRLVAGDHLFIPAHRRHRVTYTSSEPPCVWLALHVAAGSARPPERAST
jgi:cupin 2 domain-containing protein